MPHSVSLAAVLVATVVLQTACSAGQDEPDPTADPGVIALAHPFPAASLPGQAAESFATLVEQHSEGELEVAVTPEAEIGAGEQLTATLQDGAHEAVLVSTTGTGLDPRLQLQSLPFLATSQAEADALFYGEGAVADYEAGVFEEHGAHAVYQFEAGFRGLSTDSAVVRQPEDLAELRLRVAPTPWLMKAFKGWGATPENVPVDEVRSALEDGELDGQESNVRFLVGSGLVEVQDAFTDLRLAYGTFTLLVDDEVWKGLDDRQREVASRAAQEASESHRDLVEAAEKRAYKALEGEIELVRLTAKEYEVWRADIGELYGQYREVFGKKILARLAQTADS